MDARLATMVFSSSSLLAVMRKLRACPVWHYLVARLMNPEAHSLIGTKADSRGIRQGVSRYHRDRQQLGSMKEAVDDPGCRRSNIPLVTGIPRALAESCVKRQCLG